MYDSMAPLLWCPDLSLVYCTAIPGCSPGPRKSTTNCEQTAVHPLVLLTFGPLRRCRYGTGIVAVELAADPLVVMVFRRLRCCQDDQHVDCRCQTGDQNNQNVDYRCQKCAKNLPRSYILTCACRLQVSKRCPKSDQNEQSVDYRCQKGCPEHQNDQSVDYRCQKGAKR